MPTTDEVLSAIVAAKSSCLARKYDQASTLLCPVLENLADHHATSATFTPEILVRLAKLLRLWARKRDDGSDGYKVAQSNLAELLKKFDGQENDDSPQRGLVQHIL